MKYILLLILLSSCTPMIAPEAGKYYDEFVSEMDKHNISRKMIQIVISKDEKLVNDNNGFTVVTARCDNNSKIITINYYMWQQLSDCKRESLIFHELGHCELDLPHNININSIMYPHSITDCDYYMEHKNELLAEMFNASN